MATVDEPVDQVLPPNAAQLIYHQCRCCPPKQRLTDLAKYNYLERHSASDPLRFAASLLCSRALRYRLSGIDNARFIFSIILCAILFEFKCHAASGFGRIMAA